MIIIGVDPGISGAISIIENKKILEVYDIPTMIDGKKNKRQIKMKMLLKEMFMRKKIKMKIRTYK